MDFPQHCGIVQNREYLYIGRKHKEGKRDQKISITLFFFRFYILKNYLKILSLFLSQMYGKWKI